LPQSTSGQLSLPSIALRLLRAERWHAAVLGAAFALLVAVAIVPPVLAGAGARSGLRDTLSTSGGVSIQGPEVAASAQFDSFQGQAQAAADHLLGGYLAGPEERASVGARPAVTVNGSPPAGSLGRARLVVGYASDLAGHVDVLQGELPEAAQAGTSPIASMAQSRADRLGLRLGDSLCIDVARSAGQPWCARLAGLWRAAEPTDPYWASPGVPPDVLTDRNGFMSVLALHPSPGAGAGVVPQRWYWPRPGASDADAAGAAALPGRIGQVRQALAAAPGIRVQTSLDEALDRYASARTVATFSLELLTGALVVLAVLLFALMTHLLIRLHERELTLLSVRGWAAAQTRNLLLVELGIVVAAALPAGLMLAGVLLTLFAPALAVWPLVGLDRQDLLGTGAVLAAALVETLLVVIVLAERASRPGALRLRPHEPPGQGIQPRWRVALESLLVVPALPLLLLPRLAGAPAQPQGGGVLGSFWFVIWLAALAGLALAAVHLVSPASELLSRGYPGVEGTLASWQLRAWWRRHYALGFLVVFGAAVATFAAVALAGLLLGRGAMPRLVGDGAFRHGLLGALSVGLAAAVALTLLGFAGGFAHACRSREADYAALMVDGLPARSIRRSLAVEQGHVLLLGLPLGAVLGLLAGWSVAPATGLDAAVAGPAGGLSAAASILGLLLALTPFLLGGLLAARLAQSTVRLRP
jgi:hypothetical protein